MSTIGGKADMTRKGNTATPNSPLSKSDSLIAGDEGTPSTSTDENAEDSAKMGKEEGTTLGLTSAPRRKVTLVRSISRPAEISRVIARTIRMPPKSELSALVSGPSLETYLSQLRT
jgi:hypothetical protein